jgi:DNA polymerase-3 subunit delta
MEFENLKKDIESGKFARIYYLAGTEPYFIDKLTKLIEDKALTPAEASFNKAVMYGAEATAGKLLNELRSFPMMANRRLVVLKEAQRMGKAEWDKLIPYFEKPVDSTVFVIAFKGKDLDGRSKPYKALKETATMFMSKALYDNQIPAWIKGHCDNRGYKLDPEAQRILATYLGTNLALIESELEKIFIVLQGDNSKEIGTKVVYEMINIDKDFNVFELINSLGARDHAKSHFIINQMMRNVKEHAPVFVLYNLFQFYSKLLRLQSLKLSNEFDIGKALGIHTFVARNYVVAVRNYNSRELYRNLTYALEADLFLKGVQPTHMSDEHVMKTLVFKLLN